MIGPWRRKAIPATLRRIDGRPSELEALTAAAETCRDKGDWRGAIMFGEMAWARSRAIGAKDLAQMCGRFVHNIQLDVKAGKYKDAETGQQRLRGPGEEA